MIVAAPRGFRRTRSAEKITTRMLVPRSGLNYLSTNSGQARLPSQRVDARRPRITRHLLSFSGR